MGMGERGGGGGVKWTSGTTTKGNFWRISSPRVFPPFSLPFLPFSLPFFPCPFVLVCDDALKRIVPEGWKDDGSILHGGRRRRRRRNFATENGIGRMLLEIGNCESEMCCATAISVLASRIGIFPTLVAASFSSRSAFSFSFARNCVEEAQRGDCSSWLDTIHSAWSRMIGRSFCLAQNFVTFQWNERDATVALCGNYPSSPLPPPRAKSTQNLWRKKEKKKEL